MLALAACVAPKNVVTPAGDPEVGRVEGVVTDKATGKPLAGAELYFGGDRDAYWTDDTGHYSGLLVAGANRARIVYAPAEGDDAMWMTAAPFDVTAYKLTTHDFAFAPEPCRTKRDKADVDRVFELALVEFFGDRRVRIVDDRARSRGNSVSMSGVDLTTYELLHEESDRSHKTIPYWHINAHLVSACSARVTIGHSWVSPDKSLIDGDEGEFWLYGKDASGWHLLAPAGGYAT
jgi:hypothetical protein